MTQKAKTLTKAAIAHLLRAAAGVTGRTSFVMIGTGAVIAQSKTVPLDLMLTREIDVYPRNAPDAEDISDLIDGTIGEGSPFDVAFGYYAHGVGERTACLPNDWEARAIRVDLAGVECICPDKNDIALSKVCAWRDKDKAWLKAGLETSVLDIGTIEARSRSIANPNAPDPAELDRRIATLRDRSS